MRVILEIKPDTLEKLGELATKENRSRKNYMEFVLENSVSKPEQNNTAKLFQLPAKDVIQLSDFDAYHADIINAREASELTPVMREVENDKKLTGSEKFKLKQIAESHALKNEF